MCYNLIIISLVLAIRSLIDNVYSAIGGIFVATTDKALIREMKMLAKELGRTPTSTEFDSDYRTSSMATVRNHFGSWNNGIKAAGLNINVERRRFTREEKLKQIIDLASELGRTPTMAEFNSNPDTASICAITNEFGSWPNYVIEAGLKPNPRGRFKRE